MSKKIQKSNKEAKKPAAKTLKEKRAAKHAKKHPLNVVPPPAAPK